MKITVNENERGFLFRNGCFQKLLVPGVYHVFGQTTIRKTTLEKPLHGTFDAAMLAAFRKDAQFAEQTVTAEVPQGSIAVHYADGGFREVLPTGRYTFWNVAEKHAFEHYDITSPEVPDSLTPQLCAQLKDAGYLSSLDVYESQKGLLYFDGNYQRMLDPGKYYFWSDCGILVGMRSVETRLQQFALTGQEILTKDKVGVRLNFVCSYRITDPLRSMTEIENVEVQFHTAVQLTVREFIAGVTLDELLASRDTIAETILTTLRPKAEKLYIEVEDAGIRDIILPGDVRDILNTVLIAEKQAQANVITRREEVASTRSLLNTAKLMDENKTLYKLKELEYLEKICENVGNISVSGGDLLAQLREIVGSSHT